jgi:hypothetical protein
MNNAIDLIVQIRNGEIYQWSLPGNSVEGLLCLFYAIIRYGIIFWGNSSYAINVFIYKRE